MPVTDEGEIYDALGRLRSVYPNILRLEFENMRSICQFAYVRKQQRRTESPMELFEEFYSLQNNVDLTDIQKQLMGSVFEKAGGALQ